MTRAAPKAVDSLLVFFEALLGAACAPTLDAFDFWWSTVDPVPAQPKVLGLGERDGACFSLTPADYLRLLCYGAREDCSPETHFSTADMRNWLA